MAGNKPSMRSSSNCGGQTAGVWAPLSGSFQRKLDANTHAHTGSVIIPCKVTPSYQYALREGSPLKSLQSSSISRPWSKFWRSDSCTNFQLGWKKSPSSRPGTCVSAWSYATPTEFHFFLGRWRGGLSEDMHRDVNGRKV